MNATRKGIWSIAASAMLLAFLVATVPRGTVVAARQDATPAPVFSCETATPGATSSMGHGHMTGTPMSGASLGFDQMYIDMMIPHHQSIIALSQAALPRLTDERLRTIAENIIATQSAEIAELQEYRLRFYGSAAWIPMDEHMMATMMGMMMGMMPNMGSPEEMAMQMDPHAQVAAFCTGGDPDLTFIDLTIPHHQMAIAASQIALLQATHQEIKAFAQRVIDAQQSEIDELIRIRQELGGGATPSA